MISFFASLATLIIGYYLYGKFAEKVFGPEFDRTTPAIAHPDGVDFVPMKSWRAFLVQLLQYGDDNKKSNINITINRIEQVIEKYF